jgi:hypothetical protein
VSLLLPRDSALRSCARAAVERRLAAIFTVGQDLREHARFVGAALALAAALLAGGFLPGAANAAGKVPKAGAIASPAGGLVTGESGASASFTFVLTVRPSANVTFAITSSDPTEGSASPASLTFTSANWNVPQTVTVRSPEDADAVGQTGYVPIQQQNYLPPMYVAAVLVPVQLDND